MRLKTRWFDQQRPRGVQEQAGVAACALWLVANDAVKGMRAARFTISGPRYVAVLAEFLFFLVALADRLAATAVPPPVRGGFITALATRLGAILAENAQDVVGGDAAPHPEGSFMATPDQESFMAAVDACAADYATFEFSSAGPEFGFVRYLGSRIADLLVTEDRGWAMAQVADIEAPRAIREVRRVLGHLLGAQAVTSAAPGHGAA